MTFRTRLLLIFTLAVVASVGLVEWLVLHSTRQAFERMEGQRVDALVAQFRKEFDRRREEIARSVKGIAESEAVVNMAIAADPAPFYNDAAGLAAARNTRAYLLHSYPRDMGNGVRIRMREIDVPIRVAGRHWGAFRTAYKL